MAVNDDRYNCLDVSDPISKSADNPIPKYYLWLYTLHFRRARIKFSYSQFLIPTHGRYMINI